jgi:nucleoside transporter
MTDTKSTATIYPRLCIAYFCQFAIWGSWAGALGGYTTDILNLPGTQVGWLYAAIPLGAVISPLFIGPIADRFFAAQKVIALLHFLGGLCLVAAGMLCAADKQTFPLLMTLILLSGVCFMPTIALINTIVFKHLPNPDKAPQVFIFGTIGWIAINLFIAAFCGGAKTPYFFFVGGAVSIFLACYSLTLPNTPPKGAPAPGEKSDALGLGALKLFKNPTFAIFAICIFLGSIPACNYFFPSYVNFLTERGYPSPLALGTLNQFSEIFFMALLPFFVAQIGLKRVLLIGLLAWVLRYICFAQGGTYGFELALIGLILHGFCYSFLYVAAYMYADKMAPADMKASVQSLMAFLLLGVGQVLGSVGYGKMAETYPPIMTAAKIGDTEMPLPPWNDVQRENSAWKYLDLGATVTQLMSKSTDEKVNRHLGTDVDANRDNVISLEELGKVTEPLVYNEVTYSPENLKDIFAQVTEKSGSQDGSVTHTQWMDVQAKNWKMIWYLPAAFIGVFFVLFLVLGKDPVPAEVAGRKEEE